MFLRLSNDGGWFFINMDKVVAMYRDEEDMTFLRMDGEVDQWIVDETPEQIIEMMAHPVVVPC